MRKGKKKERGGEGISKRRIVQNHNTGEEKRNRRKTQMGEKESVVFSLFLSFARDENRNKGEGK